MNILYVLNSGEMGGMEKHVLSLVEGMVKKGHKVFVWCPTGDMSDMYKARSGNVFNRKINHEFDFPYIWELTRFIKKNNIDVLHAHEKAAAAHSLVAGFLSGVKVKISHTHTPLSDWRINKVKRFINQTIYMLVVNLFSDKEIALTKSISEKKHREGIRKDKLFIIPNSVDATNLTVSSDKRKEFRNEIRKKYSIPEDSFVFGCVGRLTQEKGHDILIEAFKEFLDTDLLKKNDFHLIIAGGGQLEQKLLDLAKKLGLEDKVVITGAFNEEDKVKIYSSFDVFVFPSYAEGFGISLIEAMFLKIPVICSDLDVLKEVGGPTITYFNTGSLEDLTKKMRGVYEDIASGKDLGLDKARSKVESEYTTDSFVGNYLALYQSLL